MDSSYALLTGGWYTDRNRYPRLFDASKRTDPTFDKNMYQLQEQDLTEANYIGGATSFPAKNSAETSPD